MRSGARVVRGGGRVDLGDVAREHLADDFGRGIVSVGLIGAGGIAVSLVLFFLLSGAIGAVWASIAAAAAGVAVAGRRLVFLR